MLQLIKIVVRVAGYGKDRLARESKEQVTEKGDGKGYGQKGKLQRAPPFSDKSICQNCLVCFFRHASSSKVFVGRGVKHGLQRSDVVAARPGLRGHTGGKGFTNKH